MPAAISPWPAPKVSGGVSQPESSMIVPPRAPVSGTGGISDVGQLVTVGPDGNVTLNGQKFSLKAL